MEYVLRLDLVVLQLYVLERVGGVHVERELEFSLSGRKDLHEASHPTGPDRSFEEFDEDALFEERVANVRALLDVLCRLLRQFLQTILQHFSI